MLGIHIPGMGSSHTGDLCPFGVMEADQMELLPLLESPGVTGQEERVSRGE